MCTDAANVINPEGECSLGYRLSRSSYRWANYRRQRRVERHQAIVSGIVALKGQYIPRSPPSLFI
ncbi:hypothetical protein ACNKHR_27510 [Shigella flexneri]